MASKIRKQPQPKKYYFKMTNEVLTNAKLTASEKLIFAYISNFWNAQQVFYASNKAISQALDISERTVIRSISKLEFLNLITIEYNKEAGFQIMRIIRPPFKQKDKKLEGLQDLFNSVYSKIKYWQNVTTCTDKMSPPSFLL